MNLNIGAFPAYNHRHQQANVAYRLPFSNQHALVSKNVRGAKERRHGSESFLPAITANGKHDGHRPYRRNDFANNHVFIAKHKLAPLFLNQPTINIPSKSELIHLFDQHEPKHKNWRINKNKRQENNSDAKSIPSLEQDVHLSVVNLIMKPSLPSAHIYNPLSTISHRRTQAMHFQTKTPRSSIDWINPAINQSISSTVDYTADDDLEPNTIINQLMDDNPGIMNSISNPLDLSVLYVKSIIPSAGTHRH